MAGLEYVFGATNYQHSELMAVFHLGHSPPLPPVCRTTTVRDNVCLGHSFKSVVLQSCAVFSPPVPSQRKVVCSSPQHPHLGQEKFWKEADGWYPHCEVSKGLRC